MSHLWSAKSALDKKKTAKKKCSCFLGAGFRIGLLLCYCACARVVISNLNVRHRRRTEPASHCWKYFSVSRFLEHIHFGEDRVDSSLNIKKNLRVKPRVCYTRVTEPADRSYNVERDSMNRTAPELPHPFHFHQANSFDSIMVMLIQWWIEVALGRGGKGSAAAKTQKEVNTKFKLNGYWHGKMTWNFLLATEKRMTWEKVCAKNEECSCSEAVSGIAGQNCSSGLSLLCMYESKSLITRPRFPDETATAK
ncbi:hypothetical protein DFS34DRAFT_480926 [Phlyctochytrium arcticum]|nr:hypothetical protein DFS34DRAFT_480926 [Phlyctochytrium arcticum]